MSRTSNIGFVFFSLSLSLSLSLKSLRKTLFHIVSKRLAVIVLPRTSTMFLIQHYKFMAIARSFSVDDLNDAGR